MDISCIISSGDLELYVLGLLPEEEAKKMEQLIVMFPELKAEADRISEALEALAMQTTHAPGPLAKDRIFEQLSSLKETPDIDANKPSVLPLRNEEADGSPARVIPLRKEKKNYLLVASVIGLLISIGAILFLVSENRKYKTDIAALEQSVQKANQNNTALQQQMLAYEQTLHLVQDENMAAIPLQNLPGKPQASAKVFWNKQSNEVYVMNVSLPQAPAGRQYQLWAIVDGKPVNAGMLSTGTNHAQKMHPFERADAFAITLEKEGGSPTPTMTEMYVMGKSS